MSLPRMQDLSLEEQALEKKIATLEIAYKQFADAWKDVEINNRAILNNLAHIMDSTDMATILQKIHNQKDL